MYLYISNIFYTFMVENQMVTFNYGKTENHPQPLDNHPKAGDDFVYG